MMHTFKVVGLRVERYVGNVTIGHNLDFEDVPRTLERHTLCVIKLKNDDVNGYKQCGKFEFTFTTSHSTCGSGWTTASYGNFIIESVPHFRGFNHELKDGVDPVFECDVDLPSPYYDENYQKDGDEDYLGTLFFSYSRNGRDSYYPSGYAHANMKMFVPNARAKDKRLVWIFTGPSGTGKSTIASKAIGNTSDLLSVYETDSSTELPKMIVADIIVVGNKYSFNIEDIKTRLFGEPEIHIVQFS